jgi:hypothetical protein
MGEIWGRYGGDVGETSRLLELRDLVGVRDLRALHLALELLTVVVEGARRLLVLLRQLE